MQRLQVTPVARKEFQAVARTHATPTIELVLKRHHVGFVRKPVLTGGQRIEGSRGVHIGYLEQPSLSIVGETPETE